MKQAAVYLILVESGSGLPMGLQDSEIYFDNAMARFVQAINQYKGYQSPIIVRLVRVDVDGTSSVIGLMRTEGS